MLDELAIQCMLRTLLVGIFVVTCACAASAESPGVVNAGPERWMTIRVYGNLLYTTKIWGWGDDMSAVRPLTEEDIDVWMKDCADHGVTAVLWQSHSGGCSTHPSPVFPLPGPPLRPHRESWDPCWEFFGEQVRRFDTLNVAIAAAHKYGMRFVYSLCLWDFIGSPFEQSAFHPNLWMLSRDGEPFVGVPCYAEPEVQELMLKHVRDVLDRGVDDLAISFFTHCQAGGRWGSRVDKPYYYGFNPPLVEAYQERCGSDPAHESLDANAWWALYGDFYTEFLRQLHQETSERGQRLIPCMTYEGRWGGGGTGGKQLFDYYAKPGPAPTVAPGWGIEFQWRRWAKEGIADALLMLTPAPDAVAWAQIVHKETALPVLLWRKVDPLDPPEQWATYHQEAGQVAAGALDGYVVHAMNTTHMPNYPDYQGKLWSVVQSAAGEL